MKKDILNAGDRIMEKYTPVIADDFAGAMRLKKIKYLIKHVFLTKKMSKDQCLFWTCIFTHLKLCL